MKGRSKKAAPWNNVKGVPRHGTVERDTAAGAGGRSKPEAGIAGDRDALEDAGEDTGAQ